MLNRKKIVIFVLFLADGMILFMPWNRVKVPDSARCRNPNLKTGFLATGMVILGRFERISQRGSRNTVTGTMAFNNLRVSSA